MILFGLFAPDRDASSSSLAIKQLGTTGALLSRQTSLQHAFAMPAPKGMSSCSPRRNKRIDEAAGKISIKHGPIKKKFDMDEDGMTMVFHVQDPAMLRQVKVGDIVLFDAEHGAAGFTITKLEKSQ
jgi:Cu(I)/Ag(I) efflux system protein CusF